MIERIKGILVEKSPTFVVVDVNGVGYGVNISAYTAGRLPEEGAEVTLYTNLVAHIFLRLSNISTYSNYRFQLIP